MYFFFKCLFIFLCYRKSFVFSICVSLFLRKYQLIPCLRWIQSDGKELIIDDEDDLEKVKSIFEKLFRAATAFGRNPKAFPAAAGALEALKYVLWRMLGSNGSTLRLPTDEISNKKLSSIAEGIVQDLEIKAEALIQVVGASALQTSNASSSAFLQLVAFEICIGLRCIIFDVLGKAVDATLKVIVGGVKSFFTMSCDEKLLDGLGAGAKLAVHSDFYRFIKFFLLSSSLKLNNMKDGEIKCMINVFFFFYHPLLPSKMRCARRQVAAKCKDFLIELRDIETMLPQYLNQDIKGEISSSDRHLNTIKSSVSELPSSLKVIVHEITKANAKLSSESRQTFFICPSLPAFQRLN